MANVEHNLKADHASNGAVDAERLQTRIRELQGEYTELKQALAKSEAERKLYHQALLDQLRKDCEFEDLDVPTLEKMSAGPVEMLE